MNDNSKQKDEYIKKDLRNRFDEAKSLIEQIHIIDEAAEFGFDTTEMIKDFCLDDDAKSLWKMHELAINAEIVGDILLQHHYENS